MVEGPPIDPPTSLRNEPPMVAAVRGSIASVALLTLLVCCVRLYVRKFIVHAFGLDDFLVIIALICVLAFAILSIAITFHGIGYHQVDVPLTEMPKMQYIVYVLFCLYLWVALAVKTSLTVFIMRIFPTVTIRRIGIGMIIFMAIVTISGELPLILQCKPVRAAYDKTIEDFDCFSDLELKNIQLYQAILMFIIDVIIIVLPMPTIWKLQMPIQRRLIVIGLFALGFLACAAGLARIPLLGFQDNSDYSYAGGIPLVLMNLEYALGLITGSLPSLRPLFRFVPGLKSSRRSTNPSTDWATGSHEVGRQLSSTQPPRWSRKMLGRRSNIELDSIGSESQERIIYPTITSNKSSHGPS